MHGAAKIRRGDERGQASAELVAVLPLVVLVAAIGWQLALAGYSAWMCANAARVAARAEAVGGDREQAARSALPRSLERGLRVERTAAGAVRVELRVPLILRHWRSPVAVSASAALPQGTR
ncbi:MAG TPA: TadE/TadG family type IV pilus assembly protein [Thermoleophilaceae bacterium]